MRGFTLIEVMVTVVLVAIVLGIGIPSFYDLIQRNRLATTTNQLTTAFAVARSEAVKQNTAIRVSACGDATVCSSKGTDWSLGWVVWKDSDPTDANPDLNTASGSDERLKVFVGFEGSPAVTGPNSDVIFNSSGAAAAEQRFKVLLDGLTDQWRCLKILATGAIDVENVGTGGVDVDDAENCPVVTPSTPAS